ncbi:MAG: hypothetical protein M3534_14545 [Actinomycetota bacterium]|nr:hypothetical protein [Actinomycetota bacterium]
MSVPEIACGDAMKSPDGPPRMRIRSRAAVAATAPTFNPRLRASSASGTAPKNATRNPAGR